MEADFSGYATKAGLKCSDGRTIMPGAFRDQDQTKVPLVWQHGHGTPENVLGHAFLEHREDGVYAYGVFNSTPAAQHMKQSVEHKDITAMSIYANQLMERGGRVIHGVIRELSLVLAGANPGAVIENVYLEHSDGGRDLVEDEVVIFTGLELEHSEHFDDSGETNDDSNDESNDDSSDESAAEPTEDAVEASPSDDSASDDTNDESDDSEGEVAHADTDGKSVFDIYEAMSKEEKDVVHFMLQELLDDPEAAQLAQDNLTNTNSEKGSEMTHNAFEDAKETAPGYVLTHADVQGILADAMKTGSLKESAESFAAQHLEHGIDQIDVLFPEVVAIGDTPDFLKRRTEWVAGVLGGSSKSPFSRIKTITADLTYEDARAKGYVKGTLKKEEFFGVAKRVTIPTTIYKKQKLDRDDLVDITDFDVVSWLKGEMRVMLDEEIARAILVGDGRDVAHEDKIPETNIRPIATDHELYTTVINVNLGDASSSITEVVDAIILNRHFYKGTGIPTMYTTETTIAKFLLLKDTLGRRLYKNLDELASELRVAAIVPVEVMEDTPDIVAVLVNMVDYVVGATAGGQVSMFDDFDIDYNQYKYLIESRMCGALVKPKSAMVVINQAATDTLLVPTKPTFNALTGALTIVNTANVVYKNKATSAVMNAAGSPYTVPSGTTVTVVATPASGAYYFATSEDDEWDFTAE